MSYTKELTWKQLQKYDSVMGLNMSTDYLAAYIMGQKKFNVGLGLINQWEEALKIQKAKDKQLSDTTRNNNKGITYEKEGNIKAAIKIYEKNLEIGYPATHSYTRLMIIYHKEKRYEDEVRVIKKAIEVFSSDSRYNKDVAKWQERLNKLTNK